jgi:D-alanyl-D-alanine carboxypeptidase/D-alanyl-D-alanine-endopeptidase (penicillin-binding protein 4)
LVTAVVIALAGATVFGDAWYRGHSTLPEAATLEMPEQPPAPEIPLVIRPDQDRLPTAAEYLEQRLAALAAAFELRRESRPAPGLVEFDVEGLANEIGIVLAGVGDAAQVSIHIRDLRTGHVLFDDYGDTPLNPASNQKLLTSAAALELLGSDYTFITSVRRDDTALYLVGEGDPTLQVDDLRALAIAVAPALDFTGMQRVVYDDSAFSPRRLAPGYDPGGPGLAYEAESSALGVGYNYVEIIATPNAKTKRIDITTKPATAAIVIDNKARIGSRRAIDLRTRGREGDTVVEARGTLPKRSPAVVVRRRIHDPARVAASLFVELLAEQTSSLPLPIAPGVAPVDAEEIASHESAPLLEVLDLGLAYSNNFIAEQVLRTLAWRMTGEPGSWSAGEDILRGYWSALGADPEGIVIENGSGLSRTGRLTTTGLVDLLAMAARGAGPGHSLIDALPVAGEPGTLRTRLRLSGKRVRAKTGTLDDVSGLSGVITAEDGTALVAFSILINAKDVARLGAPVRRSIEDRIVTATLIALDDYEAKIAGLVAPDAEGPLSDERPRAPWRGAEPAAPARP